MPFLNFCGYKNKHFNLSDMNFFMKNIKIGTLIRIHFGTGSGSTFSKCGFEDLDPDPLFPNVDPRIRIHVKMR